MTVEELIKQLQGLPPETVVYAWVDGDREELADVDTSFADRGFVDINIFC